MNEFGTFRNDIFFENYPNLRLNALDYASFTKEVEDKLKVLQKSATDQIDEIQKALEN